MKDIYGTEIRIDFSRSGYYRMDFKSDSWPEYVNERSRDEIPYCVSMTRKQAELLVKQLEVMFEREDCK